MHMRLFDRNWNDEKEVDSQKEATLHLLPINKVGLLWLLRAPHLLFSLVANHFGVLLHKTSLNCKLHMTALNRISK